MVAEKDHFVAAPSLERFAALGPGSEAEFLVHYEFRNRLLFRNQCLDWHQLGWQWVYPLPTRNRVSIDLWRLLDEKSKPQLKINIFGTMGNPLTTLFSESMPALQIRLKIPPLAPN